MKKIIIKGVASILVLFVTVAIVFSCKKNEKNQSVAKQKATILVDESVASVVEDEIQIYEMQYNADITIIKKSEAEIINLLNTGKYDLAVTTRRLSETQESYFKDKDIEAKVTPFAIEGIAFIANKNSKSTTINLSDIKSIVQGKPTNLKGFVFDNPNSSTKKFIDSVAGVVSSSNSKIFSLKSDKEVLSYISNHDDMIGVVGLNCISQPDSTSQKSIDGIKLLKVQNVKISKQENKYVELNETTISEGLYPFSRKVYLLNYQGKVGLGMAFAVFLSNDIGQRIVSRAGLCPITIPLRTIQIRKKI
jgi:phosphate transport system substrate-binding protein